MDAQSLPKGWLSGLKDKALAEEFRRAPFGPYSGPLRRLLAVMRNSPIANKPLIVFGDDGKVWLAELPARYGDGLTFHAGPFDSLCNEVEIGAFEIRWRKLFGEELTW